MLTIKNTDTTCAEGCGQEVNKGRKFKQGHDATLRSILYKASRAGEQVSVNGKTQSADAAIAHFGFPAPAQRVRAKKDPAKAEAAAKKSPAKAKAVKAS